MDAEIEEVEQQIRKVEQQIEDVDRQLMKAATEADVAYWRQEKEQFREREKQLRGEKLQMREKELLLLKADTSGGLPQAPKRLQDFVREAANNYHDFLCGKHGKFLRVSRNPLGDSGDPSLIWIRECYSGLQEVLLKKLASQPDVKRFVLLGTAGIGKSFFTIFWVCYLATRRVKVAWKSDLDEIFILDFSQEKATALGPFRDYHDKAIRSVVDDPDAWLILDGMEARRMIFDCHLLLACSTKPSNYTQFLKMVSTTRLYLSVWTLEEMDQFCDDFSQYRESYATMGVPVKTKVQESFELLGGVPRYVLNNCKMEEGRQLFQVAVEQLSVYRCSELLSGTFQQGFNDEIIHMCVENVDGVCNYEKYVYTFASSKAQISVWNHLRSNMPQTIVNYISDFWDAPSFGPVVGGMYEAAAHEILRRGGTFKRKRVLEGSPSEALPNLVLGELDSSNFEELKELKNIDYSQYCKPTCGGWREALSSRICGV